MANEEHVAILKEGGGPWNRWRREEGCIRPDLRGASFVETILSYADLRKANVREVDLTEPGHPAQPARVAARRDGVSPEAD